MRRICARLGDIAPRRRLRGPYRESVLSRLPAHLPCRPTLQAASAEPGPVAAVVLDPKTMIESPALSNKRRTAALSPFARTPFPVGWRRSQMQARATLEQIGTSTLWLTAMRQCEATDPNASSRWVRRDRRGRCNRACGSSSEVLPMCERKGSWSRRTVARRRRRREERPYPHAPERLRPAVPPPNPPKIMFRFYSRSEGGPRHGGADAGPLRTAASLVAERGEVESGQAVDDASSLETPSSRYAPKQAIPPHPRRRRPLALRRYPRHRRGTLHPGARGARPGQPTRGLQLASRLAKIGRARAAWSISTKR